MSKILKILLTFLLGVISFLFFVLLFFPLDSIFSHYLANIEKLSQGQYRILVKDMEPSLIFDSRFKGVTIFQKGESGFEEIFSSPQIDANISLFALITQKVDLGFSMEMGRGTISGVLKIDNQLNVLDLELEKIRLHELSYLQDALTTKDYDIKLKGEVSGRVFASFSNDNFRESEAELNLEITNFDLSRAKLIFSGMPLELPPATLSEKKSPAILQASLSKRQLRIHDLILPGPDLNLQIKGKLNLLQKNREILISRVNVRGQFSFSEKLEKMIPVMPMIENQRTTEGYFPLNITGRINKPKILIGEMEL